METPIPLADVGERRTNVVLRALIDELLERVRELHRNGPSWSAADRDRAMASLELIMMQLKRAAAVSDRDGPA
ncbi:MAG: hypothetical protein M3081_04795 [Gemmatimonadota bacterium]|nr:hypothetical protein [Gemmatimonadota bacterium]